jgi:hypothetical protein
MLGAIPEYPFEPSTALALLRDQRQKHGEAAVSRGLDEYRDSPRRLRPGDPNQLKRFIAQAARWLADDAARPPPHRNGKHPPPAPVLPDSSDLLAGYYAEVTHEQARPISPTGPGPPAAP